MVLRKGYNFVRSDAEGGITESAMEDGVEQSHHDQHEHDHGHRDYYEQLERDLRRDLYQTITVSTHFGPITGVLSAVREDYLVLVDTTGAVVLVPYFNIEFVTLA